MVTPKYPALTLWKFLKLKNYLNNTAVPQYYVYLLK